MTYSALVQQLFLVNLFGGMKLGLKNCQLMSTALQNPHRRYETIHVAGTNGKGSVSKKIAAAHMAMGKRVGLYTSPHIASFRERIRINNQLIPESSVESLLPKIFSLKTSLEIPATFFELTTLLAFTYFAEEGVDVAVIETGLGGKWDATNIVVPTLSVITSISLDHTEILGHTVEQIATEKAGIIKPNVPLVLGPRLPLKFLQEEARKLNSFCTHVSGQFIHFEEENRAIAKAALQQLNVPDAAIDHGVQAVLPCRMELLQIAGGPCTILDVAHNPDGLEQLFKAIRAKFPTAPLRLFFALSKTKDLVHCLTILKQNGTAFHLVEAPNGRSAAGAQIEKILYSLGTNSSQIFLHNDIKSGLQEALATATVRQEILVVCGTFFIMNEVRQTLGIDEPRDELDMNERKGTKE